MGLRVVNFMKFLNGKISRFAFRTSRTRKLYVYHTNQNKDMELIILYLNGKVGLRNGYSNKVDIFGGVNI